MKFVQTVKHTWIHCPLTAIFHFYLKQLTSVIPQSIMLSEKFVCRLPQNSHSATGPQYSFDHNFAVFWQQKSVRDLFWCTAAEGVSNPSSCHVKLDTIGQNLHLSFCPKPKKGWTWYVHTAGPFSSNICYDHHVVLLRLDANGCLLGSCTE